MKYATFFSYNIIGGIMWGIGMPLLGYTLGSTVPRIDAYLLPIIGGIIILSVLPSILHIIKTPEDRQKIKKVLQRWLWKKS